MIWPKNVFKFFKLIIRRNKIVWGGRYFKLMLRVGGISSRLTKTLTFSMLTNCLVLTGNSNPKKILVTQWNCLGRIIKGM